MKRTETGNPQAEPRPRSDGDSASGCAACKARDFSFCAALGHDDLEELSVFRQREAYPAGGEIFAHEGRAVSVYNLTSGCVRLVTLLADGRRQITAFVLPGEYFGAVTSERYPYGAEAVGAVSVCCYPRVRLDPFIETRAGLQRKLLDMAWKEVDRSQQHMTLLGRKTPVEKIASFLLHHAHRSRGFDPAVASLVLPMGRADIADHLGLTIETVSRTFTRLRGEGLIRTPEPHIVDLVDLPAIEAAAEG